MRNAKACCKEEETRKHIAKNKKHENYLQGIRNTKTDCKEEETLKQNAKKKKHEN